MNHKNPILNPTDAIFYTVLHEGAQKPPHIISCACRRLSMDGFSALTEGGKRKYSSGGVDVLYWRWDPTWWTKVRTFS